ncbi:MAG: PAS-domain containing protein [Emcibacteraceae bacterium]|nr:PAS-domain containing protein [Emcibacteraceae bacterium]
MISQRQDSFLLWNNKTELLLSSSIDIRFEDETVPENIDDLKSRFSLVDQAEFEANLNNLLSNGIEFSQIIDLNQFNMHLLISGNRINVDEYGENCSVVWIKDNTITEKIQRYQTLESQETSDRAKLLENALNKATFPMWIRSDDLNLQWVNMAYVEAVDGENYKNVIENNLELAINTLGVSIKSMAESVSLDGEESSESHFVVINGERRSMDFHNIPYEIDDQKEAILGYAQDITELEEARGSLADHTESYAEALDQFSSAVAIFDGAMRLEYYNKSYVRLWGLPESLLFSHPHYGEILEALHEARKLPEQANFPEWKKKQLDIYSKVIDPVESMLHLPDGKTLRVVMQQHPLGGMLVFYEDVTDYFTLESSYNTLIAVQRETLDNLHEGIAVFGVDGLLKLSNDGFSDIWEISSEFLKSNPHAIDVLNRCGDLLDIVDPIEEFKRLIVGGEVKKEASSGQFILKNEKVINYSLVPLPDGASLVIFIDVTDSYRVEYSLRKHNEALEEAQNIKTDFLAHMSYELRNPLNSVLGFAELLEKEYQGPLNDQQHQYMRNIISSSDYLLELINDILDLSVIEAGGFDIVSADFDINKTINAVVAKLDERVKQKSIHLGVKLDKTIGNVYGDERRIQHSISNLLSNAVKFTNDSGNISVKTWQDDANYFISVQDDGVGIGHDEFEDVFDKFYTGSNVPKGKGAGLGLSLVKFFIEIHGGNIMVESSLGLGTEMTCKLPKKNPLSDELSPSNIIH